MSWIPIIAAKREAGVPDHKTDLGKTWDIYVRETYHLRRSSVLISGDHEAPMPKGIRER
jgi:hypothetical protein